MSYGSRRFPVPPRASLVAALKGKKKTPTLRPFQRDGVAWMKQHGYRVLLADAPGCGKTPQALRAIFEDRKRLTPALVTCPSSVAWNWRREARVWAPGLSVHVVGGTTDAFPATPADITVCSWDLLAPRLGDLLAAGFRVIVADELHYAKNPGSQRGAATEALCRAVDHVIGLTGTPLVNTRAELDTLKRLCRADGKTPMLRRYLEDVAPDIPPKRRVALEVSIPEAALREYRTAEEDFASYIEDSLRAAGHADVDGIVKKTMSAKALARVGHLRRILGRAKAMSAAAWIVRQIRGGEPVVVLCEHQDVIQALCDVLDGAGVKYGRLDGSTARKDRQAAIDGFQRGDLAVFIGSQAAREGITLHRARHLLFVERWWTPAAEEQGEDRIRRIGQRHETFIWYMLVPDTYDERMSEIVEAKRALVASHVGAQKIERQDATGLLGDWLRGQPAAEADLEMPEFPDLPRGTKVYAFIFPVKTWTPDNVRRWLHLHGYRARNIRVSTRAVVAEMRPRAGYVPGTFRTVALGTDIGAVMGDPRRVRKVVYNRRRRPKRRRMIG